MREIKFRAWLKAGADMPTAQMIPRAELEFCRFGNDDNIRWGIRVMAENGYTVVAVNLDDNEEAVIMQYTGLHDMNGVEIYEGDIVSGEYDGGHETWEVGWDVDRDICGWSVTPEICEVMEVIGNIYESPGLLEGT